MGKYVFFICSLLIMTNCNKIEKKNENQEQSKAENTITHNQQEVVEHQIDPSEYDDTPAYQYDVFDCEDPRILELIYKKYPDIKAMGGVTDIFTLNRNDVLKTCECEGVVDPFKGMGGSAAFIIKYRAQLKNDGRIVGHVQVINPNKKNGSSR